MDAAHHRSKVHDRKIRMWKKDRRSLDDADPAGRRDLSAIAHNHAEVVIAFGYLSRGYRGSRIKDVVSKKGRESNSTGSAGLSR